MRKPIFLVLALLVCLSGCQGRSDASEPIKMKATTPSGSTKVVLLIVDSLMDKPLREAVKSGKAPAFDFLMKRGRYQSHVVSTFPTMSVAIDSTLLTGTHPDRHHIPGLVWYNEKANRIVNYGSGPMEMLKLGTGQVMLDGLIQLNNAHLNPQVPTIHEQLAAKGMQTASINALLYRGTVRHTLSLPPALAAVTSIPSKLETKAPPFFSLGALALLDNANRKHAAAWNKFGINDTFTAEEMESLIKQKKLPSLTVAYFPGNDTSAHRNGPKEIDGIIRADKQLQKVFDAFGPWDNAVKNIVWIVLGDSGQTAIDADRGRAVIDLRDSLQAFRIPKLSAPIGGADEIVLAVNERMAYVYALKPELSLAQVAEQLRRDERIDVIAWKENDVIRVRSGGKSGNLSYKSGGVERDSYGQSWSIQGDRSLLGISTAKSGIAYGDYPDALQRLSAALNSHAGRYLIATAKPGCELVGEGSPTHLGGGGHGSLHAQDSFVPMIIVGTDTNPAYMRLVDLSPWIMQLVK